MREVAFLTVSLDWIPFHARAECSRITLILSSRLSSATIRSTSLLALESTSFALVLPASSFPSRSLSFANFSALFLALERRPPKTVGCEAGRGSGWDRDDAEARDHGTDGY